VRVFVEDEEIETTPTHPFWVIGKGWVASGDMEVGDKVYLYSGEGREIKEIRFEYLDSPIKVYNFEVEDWHTYFVSEQDVFVHNSCGDKSGASRDGSSETLSNANSQGRQYNPDQQALIELAKDSKKRGGSTLDEANILLDWANEYGLSAHGPFSKILHFHIGKTGHIPIKK